MDAAALTFDQYLEADAAAQRSAEGKHAFERLQSELGSLPATRQRLAFEMVEAGLKHVAEGVEIGPLASWIRRWSMNVEAGEMNCFIDMVEKLTIQYYESFEEFELSVPELSVPILLSTIWENQPARVAPLVQRLRTYARLDKSDIRIRILDEFAETR